MSVDPVAAVAAGDLAALVDQEIAALANDAAALRNALVEGAIVDAKVLPSNGLTDLLLIAGRRVAASLPPDVRPGDQLQVVVTGFDGDRILLKVVGSGYAAVVEPSPQAAGPTLETVLAAAAGPPELPPLPVPGNPADGAVAGRLPPDGAPAPPRPAGVPIDVPFAARSAAAPPPATAVAPAATAAAPEDVQTPPASLTPGSVFSGAIVRANLGLTAVTAETAAPPAAAAAVRPEPGALEARLSALRASSAALAAALKPVPATAQPATASTEAAAAAPGRFVPPPPQITPRATPVGAAVPGVPLAGAPRATGLSAYLEPVALLRSLALPVTPSNVAAATLALERPDRLAEALATLERALPRASDDPRVATLRTLLPFVGRIDPASPKLAAQIAAFVDHVVDGPEAKIATLLAAARASEAPPATAAASGNPQHAAPAHGAPTLPAAVAAERAAALGADLKTTMLSLASDGGEALAPALAGALTALSAVQLNAAQALAAQPDGFAFAVPLATPYGQSNAYVRVHRDGSHAGVRADAENFRIAFVLETAHYGTIAIDLVTVGREVSVEVRAETGPAVRAFRDALGTLTSRLESLRYRVTSSGATVGAPTIAIEAPPSSRVAEADAVVDRSA